MNNIKNIFKNHTRHLFIIFVAVFTAITFANSVFAASVPALTLTNNTTSIGVNVTSADPNATVNFYFPNTSVPANASGAMTYTSIDIGQTDSSGSFNVSVAPNSYGLNGGTAIYVSVDGANSSQVSWPTTVSNSSGQNGSLSLSQQNVSLVNGQTATILALNTASTLSVQGNSNSSVASAYFQSNNNSVIITGLNPGSTVVSICASSYGCSSVNITVYAPTQAITFSLPTAYVMIGQPAQTVSMYGPGSSANFSISNPNTNVVAATISGTSLSLQALAVGQVTLSICASGYQCGSLVVNVVSSGTAIPNQIATPASINPDFSQSPQLLSFSVSSNDVLNQFFGTGSTITVSFSLNQTVTNVQVKIFGQQATVGQGSNGQYSALYRVTGSEILPLPVIISYTNPSGLTGQTYFWLGNSSTAPTTTTVPVTTVTPVTTTVSTPVTTTTSNTSSSVDCPAGMVCMPTATPVPAQGLVDTSTSNSGSNSSTYTFNSYLYIGMTAQGVSNPDVVALQNRLIKDGLLSSGSATGYFGPLTKAAVEKYQINNGLSPLGVVGPATRNLLNQGI